MIINKKYLFCLLIIFQSCFFIKRTPEEQVKKDVLTYLTNKYHQKFAISECKWACNEGNGCPDAYLLKCFPLENTDIKFRVDVYYGDSMEVQRDEYKSELLDLSAEKELGKIVKPKFNSFQKDINVLGKYKELDRYDIKTIGFERVINDYPEEIYIEIHLYLLENIESKKGEYIDLSREIVRKFLANPVKEVTLSIYFYNSSKYNKMDSIEINKIFRLPSGLIKDSENCEKQWELVFEKKKILNMDSLLKNIESSIYIHDYLGYKLQQEKNL
jgi:hypothetical protein